MTFTTDPRLRSFVPVPSGSHFPIQNLPFGVFRPRRGGEPRVGVAIGEHVVDLSVLERQGLLNIPLLASRSEPLFNRSSLNAFMACGRPIRSAVREQMSRLLWQDQPPLRADPPQCPQPI